MPKRRDEVELPLPPPIRKGPKNLFLHGFLRRRMKKKNATGRNDKEGKSQWQRERDDCDGEDGEDDDECGSQSEYCKTEDSRTRLADATPDRTGSYEVK